MSETIQNNKKTSEEVSVKDIISRMAGYFRFILKNWLFLVAAAVVGATFSYFRVKDARPLYTAEVTFLVEDGKGGGGGLGAYAGLASQFGLDLGGGAAGGLYQGNNFQEFLKSRLLIQRVMLTAYPKDTTLSLADVFFQQSNMKASWDANPRTAGVRFPVNVFTMTPLQDSAFTQMHAALVNEKVLKINPLRKSTILKISYISPDEYFAWIFVTKLVQSAADFYVQTKTMNSQRQVDNLQRKADSLLQMLNRRSYDAAVSQDMYPNPARRVATVGAELSMMDKLVTQTLYTEVIKNLEMSKAALAQEMPIIQMVDKPVLPLIGQKRPLWVSMSLWAGMMVVLTAGVLTAVRLFKSIYSKA